MPNFPTRTFFTALPLGALIRVGGLVVGAALALGSVGASAPVAAQDAFDAGAEQALLDRINAVRGQAGSGPLARDGSLDAAARTHSAEMAASDQLMHVSPHTGTPIDRVHAAGLATDEVAENVAMHASADAAQQALEASDAHLANMLNPRFTHVGISAARDEGGIYVTQVFARIEAAAPAPPPAAVEPAVAAPFVAPPIVAEAAPAPAPAAVPAAPMGPPAIASPGVPVAPAVSPPPAASAPSGPAGAPGQVLTVRRPDGATQGYWVCGSGRWWYYPLPTGTTAGQLQADLSVSGSPPGYGACTAGPSGPVAAAPAPAYGPRPGYSARAYGPGAYGGVYGAPGPVYAPRYAPAPPPAYHRPRVVVPGAVIGPWGGGVRVIGPQPYGRRVIILR